ncbi:MAG: hypothetical protein FWD42_03940, partial [Solirubrobacterales bacterium]|nr:hypothetical protein [Solirubrobacterales bacterium]
MSAPGRTEEGTATRGVAGNDLDAVEEIIRHGGESLRERMARAEEHLETVTAEAGAPLAAHATATIVAGG